MLFEDPAIDAPAEVFDEVSEDERIDLADDSFYVDIRNPVSLLKTFKYRGIVNLLLDPKKAIYRMRNFMSHFPPFFYRP